MKKKNKVILKLEKTLKLELALLLIELDIGVDACLDIIEHEDPQMYYEIVGEAQLDAINDMISAF